MVAGEYFDDLAMRSFFQDFKKYGDGSIIRCKMHDFLHDMAEFLTKDECHIMETNEIGLANTKVRHLNALNMQCATSFMAKNLRTLILEASTPTQVLKELFLLSTCLRELDLHGCDLVELPDEVQCLVHQRYLNLSDTELRMLPETLCNLYNLQTLKLNRCWELGNLPEGMGRLSNLRHIEIKRTLGLEYIPQSIGRLSQLRTLSKFIVSDARRACKVGELRDLNSFTGKLRIHGLGQVENVDESKWAQMLKKKDLAHLRFDFGYSQEEQVAIEDEEARRMEGVLEALQPNAHLERLTIDGYPGLTFPFWMTSKSLLGNVIKLKLMDCRNCLQLPALGSLKSLEDLTINGLESVKQIGAEFYGEKGDTSFPKLKMLSFVELLEWEDWKIPFLEFKKVMPHLFSLEIKTCRKLMALPALGRLESLESVDISQLDSLKAVGTEFLGISSSCDGRVQKSNGTVVFSRLRMLRFREMAEWQQHEETEDKTLISGTVAAIMPCLQHLEIESCPKLKVLPAFMFPHSLRKLVLRYCPQLMDIRWFPPQHEEMKLEGVTNVISRSSMPISCDHNYPNLRSVEIYGWALSSLPRELSKFRSLQQLKIAASKFLDLKPEEDLGHFPMLQPVKVSGCPTTTERCSREDWSNNLSSHIADNFWIDIYDIVGTKRGNEGEL